MKNKRQRMLSEEYKDLNKKALENIFLGACFHGDLELADFVLTSPTLKLHANIHQHDDLALSHVCSEGHLELVQYLLYSPNLKEHIEINTQKDIGFRLACVGKQWKVVKYFIFDCNIEKSEFIDEYLERHPNKKVENMFKLREKNRKTNEKLSSIEKEKEKTKLKP